MFTAQLCCQAACTQAQIIRTFGVSKNSVLRSVAKYRREGIDGFYRPRGARCGAVMTAQVTAEAERLLGLGYVRREVAEELGKLMGLDRVPEVRCLRKKLAGLSQQEAPQRWAAVLSKAWREQNPQWAGALYVDGHVRLYHGHQTKLPRRYVARQRLCLCVARPITARAECPSRAHEGNGQAPGLGRAAGGSEV